MRRSVITTSIGITFKMEMASARVRYLDHLKTFLPQHISHHETHEGLVLREENLLKTGPTVTRNAIPLQILAPPFIALQPHL